MIERIAHLLALCGGGESVMPPTVLFNEGWLLRLALDWYSHQPLSTSLLRFDEGARWYSEGRLASPFLARRRGDPLAEGYTHPDGVIGHFDVKPGERSEILVAKDATQFVVIEAKLGSPLSSGTRNARDYDQAARSAACLAHVVALAGCRPDALSRVAFCVIAPNIRVETGVFGDQVSKASILEKVKARVRQYGGTKDEWFAEAFLPALAHFSVDLLTWEDIVEEIEQTEFGESFREFYVRCLEFARLPYAVKGSA